MRTPGQKMARLIRGHPARSTTVNPLLGFFMRSVLPAETAILFKLQSIRRFFLVLRCGIVPTLALAARQMNNVPHRPKPIPGPVQTSLILFQLNYPRPARALNQLIDMEPTIGIEPMTSSLPRKCSTTELRGHFNVNDSPIPRTKGLYLWSGKRDSNPRPSAWKADALAN